MELSIDALTKEKEKEKKKDNLYKLNKAMAIDIGLICVCVENLGNDIGHSLYTVVQN